MADPVDDLIDEVTTPPATVPDANNTTINADELKRLQEAARKLDEVAPVLQQLQQSGALNQARIAAIEQPVQDDTEAIWANPKQTMQQIARDVMSGPAAQMSEKLGRIMVANFKASKASSPFYAVALPYFEQEISTIPLASLGSSPDEVAQRTLNIAWNSAVGEYTQRRANERPKPEPPVNLGGGSTGVPGGGPKQKRTLQEVDPVSYSWAVQNGLTEEEMQEIADGVGE